MLPDILRKGLAGRLFDAGLVFGDDLRPVLGGEIGIEGESLLILVLAENILELMMLDAQDDIRIHLDEAAIAVIGEAAVLGARSETLDGRVIEAEIEHGVHHARHRRPGA